MALMRHVNVDCAGIESIMMDNHRVRAKRVDGVKASWSWAGTVKDQLRVPANQALSNSMTRLERETMSANVAIAMRVRQAKARQGRSHAHDAHHL
jgi:hypothetical protein